jgi:hypothetical protein
MIYITSFLGLVVGILLQIASAINCPAYGTYALDGLCKQCPAGSYPSKSITISSKPNGWYMIEANPDFSKIAVALYSITNSASGQTRGLYISNDGGGSWSSSLYPSDQAWVAVRSNKAFTKFVAAVHYGYLYLSTDAGKTWSQLTSAGSEAWQDLAVTDDFMKIFAMDYKLTSPKGRLSTDGGISWFPTNLPPATTTKYMSGVTANSDFTKIVLAVISSSLYLSTDQGQTWVALGGGGSSASQSWLGVSANYDMSIIIGAASKSGFFISKDSGATFKLIGPAYSWAGVTISEDGSKIAAVEYPNGIWQSSDGGQTWVSNGGTLTDVPAPTGGATSITSCPAGTYAPAGAASCLLCPVGSFSATGASACTACNTGTTTPDEGTAGTSQTVCNQCGNGYQGAVPGESKCSLVPAGNYPSKNIKLSSSVGGWYHLTASPDFGKIAVAMYSKQSVLPRGIYLTSDGGSSWTTINSQDLPWVSVKANKAFTKFIGVSHGSTNIGGMYTSVDSGTTWIRLESAGWYPWQDVVVSDDFTKILGLPIVSGTSLAFYSNDGGATFNPFTLPTMTENSGNTYVHGVWGNDDLSTIILACYNAGLWRSYDSGSTWSKLVGSSALTYLAVSASHDTRIIVATTYSTYGAIYISNDYGNTFQKVPQATRDYFGVAVSDDGMKIVACEYKQTIWQSIDGGNTFVTNAMLYNGAPALTGPATGMSRCPAGTFAPAGATSCILCPVGSYSATGASACTACSKGTTTSSSGTPGSNKNVCNQCGNGYYGTSVQSCTLCPAGNFPSKTITLSSSTPTGWYHLVASPDFDKLAVAVYSKQADLNRGLYISSDGGASWGALNAVDKPWVSVRANRAFTKFIGTVHGGYIYQSIDSGASWTAIVSAGVFNWQDVATSEDFTKIYAITAAGGASTAVLSSDGGLTWGTFNVPSGGYLHSIATNAEATAVIVAVWMEGIQKTDDDGANWTILGQTGFQALPWLGVAVSEDLTKIVAVTYSYSSSGLPGYIYISNDSGATFSVSDMPSRDYFGVTMSDDGSKIAVTVYKGSIWQSADGGQTWATNGQDFKDVPALAGPATSITYCPMGSYAPAGATSCILCPVGSFSATGASACTACNTGTTTPDEGTPGSNQSVCNLCAPGYNGSPAGNGCVTSASPTISPTMNPTANPTTPLAAACTPGKYFTPGSSDSGIPNCSLCPVGKYQPQNEQSLCEVCPAGKASDNIGSSISCFSCSAGTYAPTGSSSCIECGIGEFSKLGASICSKCKEGKYGDESGLSTCLACSAGKFSSVEGAEYCTTCDAGKYSTSGSSICIDCLANHYSLSGQMCSLCPEGLTSVTGSSTCIGTEVLICSAGKYNDGSMCKTTPAGFSTTAGGSLMPCHRGAFSLEGSSLCSSCTAGTWSNEMASVCTPCSPGFYALPGQDCELCPAGKYSDAAGSTTCSTCGEGSYSQAGDSHCSTCLN